MRFECQFRPQLSELAKWLKHLQGFAIGFRVRLEDSQREPSKPKPFGMIFLVFVVAGVIIPFIDFPLFR